MQRTRNANDVFDIMQLESSCWLTFRFKRLEWRLQECKNQRVSAFEHIIVQLKGEGSELSEMTTHLHVYSMPSIFPYLYIFPITRNNFTNSVVAKPLIANATKVKITLIQETQTSPSQNQEGLILILVKQASVYQYIKLDRHRKKAKSCESDIIPIVSLITPLYL